MYSLYFCSEIACSFDFITASRLGLYAVGGSSMSGEQVEQLDIVQLQKLIPHIAVFYRVSPRHKHKIVKVSSTHRHSVEYAS